MDWADSILAAMGAFAIATTILPVWHTARWWVRIWDFPRFQIALTALSLFVATLALSPPVDVFDWMFVGSMLSVVAWQSTWVGPYLPGAPRQVQTSTNGPGSANRIKLLTTNVLQKSRNSDRLLEIIREADPDVALAVEVDEWWVERLSTGLSAKFPYKIIYPLSNGYGLALFSRLELIEPEVRFVLDEAIPSIRTGIRLRSGIVIAVYGVHPRPPSVQQDSTERDVELLRVALEIRERGVAALVLGDLNDVAWSPTTQNFMKSGHLLDPRRGRGFYNTYPARWPGLRYPLDYIFATKHFKIGGMRVLPAFGSDHLPLVAELYVE
jgi:endonuclease/exonuclease/phosphatase (EEP) superfamily protein YafD